MTEKRISYTPSQLAAINAPIMDLLVSAAAGSGKTAVLSQRILHLVSMPDTAADLSRMLVVTFTKAAASELRAKIGKALFEALQSLREQLASGVNDELLFFKEDRLSEALDKLEGAEISTIHSFCYSLVKKHFSELGLSASLRIGDETECVLLKMRTMEETIDALYESDPDFPLFAENLIDLRDNRLAELLLKFYDKFSSLPMGIAFIENSALMLEKTAGSFDDSPLSEAVYRVLDNFFDYHRARMEEAIEAIREDSMAMKKYYTRYAADLDFLSGWQSVRHKGFFAVGEYIKGYSVERTSNYIGKKPPSIERAAAFRSDFSSALKELKGRYFIFSEDDLAADAVETAAYAHKLYEVLVAFEGRYREEKLRYGILDYCDLEQYAYRLLLQDGKPTPLALSVQKKYDAIFIDEYQDTNDLQDAIFAAISSHNRFMVGDIKQSIYGFRGAVPELFSGYRDRFPRYREGMGQKEGVIFLSENFRSDASVLEYSNRVFEKLFNNNSGRVPYLPDDALRCTRKEGEDALLPTRLLSIDKKVCDENGEPLTEMRVVARKIASLVRSGVEPNEIVILLRSMTHAEDYRKELQALSVDAINDKDETSLFDRPEVLLLISLLNVIDNPTRDIYLAAVLKSPIFGVTMGEMVTLRRLYPAHSLYASLQSLTADEVKPTELAPLLSKLERFFVFLDKARRFAERKAADKVVRYLFDKTPLRAIAVKESGSTDALFTFYDFARAFESGGFVGLHGFVRRMKEIEANKDAKAPRPASLESLAAVEIMTIHHSKGCEYNYVFLCETANAFNKDDQSASLVYEKSLGLGLKLREKDGFVRYDTLIRRAIATRIAENAVDEEMRVLYVALTRAKKQLWITSAYGGARQKSVETVSTFLEHYRSVVHPQLYADASSYFEWLALTVPDTEVEWVRELPSLDADLHQKEAKTAASANELTKEALEARLNFTYPYAALASLPSKLSVSRLYPGILDDEAEELLRAEVADFDRLPLFMQEKAEVSGAERGTATHLFMQFCDFDAVASHGVDAEIDRLVEKSFITAGIASLIYRDKLKAFFESALFARILSADKVYREERFNVRLPAHEFTLDPDKAALFRDEYILVQGVVDCLVREKDGSLILIDYKTDRTPKDRRAAEAMLRKRYTTQLAYYRRAVEAIFKAPVKKTLIYSFGLADTVEIR